MKSVLLTIQKNHHHKVHRYLDTYFGQELEAILQTSKNISQNDLRVNSIFPLQLKYEACFLLIHLKIFSCVSMAQHTQLFHGEKVNFCHHREFKTQNEKIVQIYEI